MKTKFFTGLLVAVALLIGGPAFAHDHGGGGRGGGGGGRMSGAFSSGGRSFRSNPSFAFGGNSYYSRGGGGRSYAFGSRSGWSHDRQYNWNGHRYGWYGNGWYDIDPYPYAYYGYEYPYEYDSGPAYTVYGDSYYNGNGNGGGSAGVQVQDELARDGYYRGPVDGIVGPMTEAAIAAYQRDNGLRVTGTINHSLLASMGLD